MSGHYFKAMAKVAQYVPISTPYGWMISIPPKLSSTGKRVKKYFKNPTAAETFAKKLRAKHESGIRGGMITATLAIEATEATRLIKESGINLSLVEAVRIAIAASANQNHTETVRERYNRMLLACEMLWSNRYARDMGKIERWIGKDTMERKCSEISQTELEKALRSHGAKSKSTLHARSLRVNSVLNFKDRHRRQKSEIEILTPAETKAVLDHCTCKEERWVVALLIFAGIRPDSEEGEIAKLRWEAIGKREIYLSPDITKTKTDRHVPITPRLARELTGHPTEGKVIPANWKKRWQTIRKNAGIAAKQDVLRHTFASHYLAAFGEDEAKQAMGHSKGSDILFRNYRRAVTTEAGKAFFQ